MVHIVMERRVPHSVLSLTFIGFAVVMLTKATTEYGWGLWWAWLFVARIAYDVCRSGVG